MLLRALSNLSNGIRRGDVFTDSRLKPKTTAMLLARHIIAPASTPPISAIEGLAEIADVLKSAGVVTLEDLIVAKAVDGFTAEELAEWQAVATCAMTITKPCGCRR